MKYKTSPKRIISTILLSSILCLSSCFEDLEQGKSSLEGKWNVTEITSIYSDFSVKNGGVNGIGNTDKKIESGDLGFFEFSSNQVSYNFSRNDTVYKGNGFWELKLEKVNQGFFKVNKWQLMIADDYLFEVRFEDGTSNSEKNSKSIKLDNWPKNSGKGVAFFLNIDK